MPDLSQLPVPLFSAGQPYHWEYDNLPLQALKIRDEIINGEVENHNKILQEASGDQGTLSNRLNQSLELNGNLRVDAIDDAAHNIAEHTDGSKIVSGPELTDYVNLGFPTLTNPVSFVRMLEAERIKLAAISDDANYLEVIVEDDITSGPISFDNGQIEFLPSTSIHWEVTAPNQIKPVLNISTAFAHRHFYDIEPICPTSGPGAYQEYTVPIPFVQDSLRVYINGIRINTDVSVYYPSNPVSTWSLNRISTSDYLAGTFVLLNAIDSTDIIKVDFDQPL